MGIFYIRYEAAPNPKSPELEEAGGAYISCWIKAESVEAAKSVASKAIEENNWKAIQVEEMYPVTEGTYNKEEENYEYFQQAKLDEECYVYHVWPDEPQENSEIH